MCGRDAQMRRAFSVDAIKARHDLAARPRGVTLMTQCGQIGATLVQLSGGVARPAPRCRS
jgi:hypothetical protein